MPDDINDCTYNKPIEWIEGLAPAKVCPVRDMTDFNDLFGVWNWSVKGHLPYSGGYLEQPASIMQALNLMSSIINHRDEK